MIRQISVPLTADDESLRALDKHVWYWKRKFLVKRLHKDKEGREYHVYYVYNKWDQRNGGSDLCWFSPSIKSIKEMFEIMNEEIPHELVEEANIE